MQPLIQSSYDGYGHSSVDQDAEDISHLVKAIRKENPKSTVVFMGHSTGCQDAVTYCKKFNCESLSLNAVILQAPVSDREAMALESNDVKKWSEIAKKMIAEGNENEFMPRDSHFSPITAYRYNSLSGRMTDDDMFSSDLKDTELKQKLYCVNVPTADEYVPESVDVPLLAQRISGAMQSKDVKTV
eukprot:CAMPEP_0167742570 /NCGR_PEP_ID=MMETSP0110_2-20121227/1509_1 /TAXON_ID=629695 /ORGANISM="Gymnochlora sp., Strain CCMP2014" /LENGTH=185 /DNA_ID=CAMNT_0007626795 /DNA_START=167 /DNA_END=721 /DNA_ORIENTATION=+